MTPLERLQAAIDKLEHHVDESWYFEPESDEGPLDRFGAVDATNPGGGRQVLGETHIDDAELIVALHRTIDAQLAILRTAKNSIEAWWPYRPIQVDPGLSHEEMLAVALADAILGSDSPSPATTTVAPERPAVRTVRDPECLAAWPECFAFGYDPRCCRFPKSCSCERVVSPEGDDS